MTRRNGSAGTMASKKAPIIKIKKADSKNRPFHFIFGSLESKDFLAKRVPVMRTEVNAKTTRINENILCLEFNGPSSSPINV